MISGGLAILQACDGILRLVRKVPKHSGLKTGEWEIWNELIQLPFMDPHFLPGTYADTEPMLSHSYNTSCFIE